MELSEMKLNVVGIGNVSSALAKSIRRNADKIGGLSVTFGHLVSRDQTKAQLLAEEVGGVPVTYGDDFILNGPTIFGLNDTVLPLAPKLLDGKVGGIVALHLSGYHPSSILPRGWLPASMHPNLSVASPDASFDGVVFGIEGSPEGVAVAVRIAELLGGRWVTIETSRKREYHLAAVLVSNLPFAFFALAEELYEIAGVSESLSRELIVTLLSSVSRNIQKAELHQALTGPIKRRDLEVIREEGELFKKTFPDFCELYDKSVEAIVRFLLASSETGSKTENQTGG